MNDVRVIEADLSDLDRDLRIPMSKMYSWSQMNRHKSFFNGSLREFIDTTGGTLLVKAQVYWFDVEDTLPILANNRCITVAHKVASVSKNSFILRYDFYAGSGALPQNAFAHGYIALVSAKNGKTLEMPVAFAQKLARGVTEEEAKQAQVLRESAALSTSWKDSPEPAPNVPPFEVIVRPSDEDMNSHVNQGRYPAYYDDAIRAIPGLRDVKIRHMFVDYIKETRRGWRLHVIVRKLHKNEAIMEIVDASKPEILLSRCVASWILSPESTSAL